MSRSKTCPLCGQTYGPGQDLCPVDGRTLVRSASAIGLEPGVRLSRDTEDLIGSLLAPTPTPDRKENDATTIGPPPQMREVQTEDFGGQLGSLASGDDKTVAGLGSEVRKAVREAALAAPLAALPARPAASLPPPSKAGYGRGGSTKKAKHLANLQLEYDTLHDREIDIEVTTRMQRSELSETLKTGADALGQSKPLAELPGFEHDDDETVSVPKGMIGNDEVMRQVGSMSGVQRLVDEKVGAAKGQGPSQEPVHEQETLIGPAPGPPPNAMPMMVDNGTGSSGRGGLWVFLVLVVAALSAAIVALLVL